MIAYLRTSAAGFDIRLRKYLQACEASETPYLAITWDRMANATILPNEYTYPHAAPYGYGHRFKNFMLLLGWYLFAFSILIKHRKEYKVIHACNVETIPLAVLMRLFLGKKAIFDIYDTSGHFALERFFIKHSDLFVLPTERRLEQEGITKEEVKNFLSVENVPVFKQNIIRRQGLTDDEKIVISYVGTFQRNIRGLENLLKLVLDDGRFVLEIAGTGDNFEKDLTDASMKCSRVHYYGAVSYDKALEIMGNSDFIYAHYFMSAPTHKYASPNKFYESLFLGVPLITTKGTLVGNLVSVCNTGYVIGEQLEDLRHLFANIDSDFKASYHERENSAGMKWDSEYADYFKNHMAGKYISICRSL